ncbi:MAG TPA: hypothetical protein VG253_22430 [Streptosporangiaceae bacterium]|nr:hypothetical protein [Streptosporangiaceae bacterium]
MASAAAARRLMALPIIVTAAVCLLGLAYPQTATSTSSTAAKSTARTTSSAAQATSSRKAPAVQMPKSHSQVDCNGWSPKYHPVRPAMRALCTDPVGRVGGKASRFTDNGWYVGHDEPSVKFISHARGSGNTMTYYVRLPVDPAQRPTSSGSVTTYAELSVAPWFGLPVCDPRSYPQNPCKPDSDRNIGLNTKKAAGSAFMELQFYPPGFTPWFDNTSCSATQWCGALNIDSLECTFNQVKCNNNCIEPVNFSFLQTNGIPSGPPSPQGSNVNTFTPNGGTLKMNEGDLLKVSITDPAKGFTTTVRDLTTHQTGFMTASAHNGFMNTSLSTCAGHPFTFHAEYNTARKRNLVPWAALQGGVLMEQEIGHFEACRSLLFRRGVSAASGGTSFNDPGVFQTCVGGSETPTPLGEGPCSIQSGLCQNAATQGRSGPVACPTNNPASGQLCEFSDGNCFPKGSRPVVVNGKPTVGLAPISGCNQTAQQNGDLDFDGTSYQPRTWPNGSASQPTSISYVGPFDRRGRPYPQIQFETDVAGSEHLCDVATGRGCVVPPGGARFYPYWSLAAAHPNKPNGSRQACVWNFGASAPGVTLRTFGKDAQYGKPGLSWYGGTLISAVQKNPQFSGRCQRARG